MHFPVSNRLAKLELNWDASNHTKLINTKFEGITPSLMI
jgi:hypothetical protein